MQSMAEVLNLPEQPADPQACAPGVGHLVDQGGGHQEVDQVAHGQVLGVENRLPSIVKDGGGRPPLTCHHFIRPPGIPAVGRGLQQMHEAAPQKLPDTAQPHMHQSPKSHSRCLFVVHPEWERHMCLPSSSKDCWLEGRDRHCMHLADSRRIHLLYNSMLVYMCYVGLPILSPVIMLRCFQAAPDTAWNSWGMCTQLHQQCLQLQ